MKKHVFFILAGLLIAASPGIPQSSMGGGGQTTAIGSDPGAGSGWGGERGSGFGSGSGSGFGRGGGSGRNLGADGGRNSGRGRGGGSGRGGQGSRRGPPPLEAALDSDRDGYITAEELTGATAALQKLDVNGDGTLSADEYRPQRPGGGRDRKSVV